MNLTVPVYVEKVVPAGESVPAYRLRPLFHPGVEVEDSSLDRGLRRLAKDLRQRLGRLAAGTRQEELAGLSFHPRLHEDNLDVTVNLRRSTSRCRFHVVFFHDLDRTVAFTPRLPDLWFDVQGGESLASRATDLLTGRFRDEEKEEGEDFERPEARFPRAKAWVDSLSFQIDRRRARAEEEAKDRLALESAGRLNGAEELEKVGRSLHWLYPDGLDPAVRREREITELTALLTSGEKQPVVLVGPRQAGKTAVLHGFVARDMAGRESKHPRSRNVWLLSGQRLVSGMSYVGQWERRLLAILDEAKEQGHVLYFDQFLGLYHAGRSAGSSLSMADVLKPFVERGEVRILAEMSPEELRIFAERDRGFADLFRSVRIDETGEEETLRVLIEVLRRLEGKHRACFGPDVLPAVLDVTGRHVRDAVFPGKGAELLRQLAVKHAGKDVGRREVLAEFQAKSGLDFAFLDPEAALTAESVTARLQRRVMGQDAGTEALAEAVVTAKERLNDPARPLGTFLFLGPTGVGKTECAKALAECIYGDEARLLRFDMNELSGTDSAARLVGTLDAPEGLLTSAVRRQPFAVVLLDEIEKAHPDVFNVLLQVLGEGRLTDALGRTADFRSTFVILTSNLGVSERAASVGFRREGSSDAAMYVAAAERFFSPEFFNRIDRVVPFERLCRDEVRRVAGRLVTDVCAREGLKRRWTVLRVHPRVLDCAVESGYDAALGARSMKRAVEREVAVPLAALLSSSTSLGLSVVALYPRRGGIAVQVQALEESARSLSASERCEGIDPQRALDSAASVLACAEEAARRLRPEGLLDSTALGPEHFRYYALGEEARRVRRLAEALERSLRAGTGAGRIYGVHARGRPPRAQMLMRRCLRPITLREMSGHDDLAAYMEDVSRIAAPLPEGLPALLLEFLREAAFLHAMSESAHDADGDRALFAVWPRAQEGTEAAMDLARFFDGLLREPFGLELRVLCPEGPPQEPQHRKSWPPGVGSPLRYAGGEDSETRPFGFLLEGPFARSITESEEGTHLFNAPGAQPVPLSLVRLPLRAGDDPARVLRDHAALRAEWLRALEAGESSVEADPVPVGQVVRLYGGESSRVRTRHVADLRTLLVSDDLSVRGDLRAFVLSALDLPPEVRE